MAGTHSKDLLSDVKLAISKLINRKAINKLEVFKAVVIVMTAGILISSLITALFFADNAEHQKMVKGTKEVIKMSGSMETAIIRLRQENKDISAYFDRHQH